MGRTLHPIVSTNDNDNAKPNKTQQNPFKKHDLKRTLQTECSARQHPLGVKLTFTFTSTTTRRATMTFVIFPNILRWMQNQRSQGHLQILELISKFNGKRSGNGSMPTGLSRPIASSIIYLVVVDLLSVILELLHFKIVIIALTIGYIVIIIVIIIIVTIYLSYTCHSNNNKEEMSNSPAFLSLGCRHLSRARNAVQNAGCIRIAGQRDWTRSPCRWSRRAFSWGFQTRPSLSWLRRHPGHPCESSTSRKEAVCVRGDDAWVRF